MTRYRLERGEGLERYPVMAEFRAEGATDYLVFVMPFLADGVVNPVPTGAVVTLATDRPGGFSDADVAATVELMPELGRRRFASASISPPSAPRSTPISAAMSAGAS